MAPSQTIWHCPFWWNSEFEAHSMTLRVTNIQEIDSRDRTLAVSVAFLLFACYLLTYTATIDSSDGLAMFATTESMVRRGEIDSNSLLWMGNQQGNLGP